MVKDPNRFWNPYLGGVALGLVLLATFLVMGKGLGASGATFRTGVWAVNAVAPAHAANVPAMSAVTEEGSPLNDWLVFEVVGVLAGGLIGALTSGRFGRETLRGPTFPAWGRIALALAGGAMMGFAAKLTRGCTSGQGLSGGSLLSVGAWAFMLSVFAGGYAAAYFLRRQWR
ncbi:MAG: YeeE/YedE thiosulfate transporter family protein [Anaeromyxobacteraceae bacterium]